MLFEAEVRDLGDTATNAVAIAEERLKKVAKPNTEHRVVLLRS